MNRTVNEKVLAILEYEKILGNICFSEQIFHRKQSLGAPVSVQFKNSSGAECRVPWRAESLRSFLDLSRKDRSDSASRVNAVKIT